MQEQRGERRTDQLHDDVSKNATPWEVATQRERDADRGIEVSAGHLAHEEDDRHHHQTGCDDCGGTADRVGKGLPHHAATGGHEDEEERSEQLREEAAPLLARIVEVLQRRDDLVIQMAQCSAGLCLRH